MSTLIAYSSKYGFTKSCAEKLSSELEGEVDIVDLNKNVPVLKKYEKIIIGGSVYGGKIRKEVTKFCTDNMIELSTRKLGLFACGMVEGEKAEKQFQTLFPQSILGTAVAKDTLGYGVDFKKMNFLERFIMKMITKSDESRQSFFEQNISSFAKKMNNA